MNIIIEVGNSRYGVDQEVAQHIGDLKSQITQLRSALEKAEAAPSGRKIVEHADQPLDDAPAAAPAPKVAQAAAKPRPFSGPARK
jgi:hypothetical protein